MVLSPLAQFLVVAVLAYGAGLLLGLSFYRGEIGPARRAAARPLPSGLGVEIGGEPRRRRRRRKQRSFQEQLGDRARKAVVLLFMLAFITVLGLGFYSVMGAGAEVLQGHAYAGQTPPDHPADPRVPGRR